jgi:hypothetical protein
VSTDRAVLATFSSSVENGVGSRASWGSGTQSHGQRGCQDTHVYTVEDESPGGDPARANSMAANAAA